MKDCVEWTGAKTPKGYGLKTLGNKQYYVHRLAWEIENGPIPKDMFVCHKCDNPSCINPEHLFLGTPKDNTADMIAKGRQYVVPIANPLRDTIRALYQTGMYTKKELAVKFNLSFGQVNGMVKRLKNYPTSVTKQKVVVNGPKLKSIRLLIGFKQKELADFAHIAVERICRIEHNKHFSCFKGTAVRLANVLDVEIERILV